MTLGDAWWVTIEGPFTRVDFLTIIEWRRAECTDSYGILYDLCGITGEPSIADLRAFMNAAEQTTRPRGHRVRGHRSDDLRAGLHVCRDGAIDGAGDRDVRDLDEAEQWLTAQAKAMEQGA